MAISKEEILDAREALRNTHDQAHFLQVREQIKFSIRVLVVQYSLNGVVLDGIVVRHYRSDRLQLSSMA